MKLKVSTRERIEHAIRLGFPMSNNETEYEAILVGVDLAKYVSSEKLTICSDSQLVVGQVNERRVRNMRLMHGQVRKSGQATTRKFCSLESLAYPEGLK